MKPNTFVYACDTCGAPATSMARDMRLAPSEPGDTAEAYEPVGNLKAGCALHPVTSITYSAADARFTHGGRKPC